jgi:hypothetical protein
MSTNYSTAVMLFNDDIKGVLATYEPETNFPTGKTTPKKVFFKTLDKTLKVGDIAVVPSNTRHNFTTVKIVETDVTPDFDSDIEADWIVAKVDIEAHTAILEEEKVFVNEMKKSEAIAKKETLRKNMENVYKNIKGDNLKITTFTSQSSVIESKGDE